ncbi:MAG: CHAT domain-containing protein [Jejuia sp.]
MNLEELWDVSYNKGYDLFENKDFKNALKQFQKADSIANIVFKRKDWEYGDTVYSLANIYSHYKDTENALNYYLKFLDHLRLNKFKKEPEESITTFLIVARLCNGGGNFNKTLKILEDALPFINKQKGKNSAEYYEALNYACIALKKTGQIVEAIKFNKEQKQIIIELYGANSNTYASNLNLLSQLYIDTDSIDKADSIVVDALNIFKENNSDSLDYISALFTKSLIFRSRSQFNEEIETLKEAKRLSKPQSEAYISILNNMSVAYEELGNFEKTFELSKEVLSLTSPNNPNYVTRLQNVAFNYAELGEYETAFKLYNDALGNCINTYGKNHLLYAKLEDCIGQFYFKKGEFSRANEKFKIALNVFLNNQPKTHQRYNHYLLNYTETLILTNQTDEAINLLLESIDISQKENDEHEYYFRKKIRLAEAYIKLGNKLKGIEIINQNKKKLANYIGKNHIDYANVMKTLGLAYLDISESHKGIQAVDSFNTIIVAQIDKIFKFRSEKEKKSFLRMTQQSFDELQTLAFDHNFKYDQLNIINLKNQIFLKGLLLNSSKNIIHQLSQLNNAAINNKISDYRILKSNLLKTLSKKIELREYDINVLEKKITVAEVELVKLFNDRFKKKVSTEFDWKTLKNKFNDKEVAVELANFNLRRKAINADSTMYVAYVLSKEKEFPLVQPLFEEKKLKNVLSIKNPSRLYASRGSNARGVPNGKKLYQLIWKPLKENLLGKEKVYYSPSGLLNKIAFAALIDHDGKLLCETYELHTISNLSVLSKASHPNFHLSDILLIGGVDYNNTEGIKNSDTATAINASNSDLKLSGSWGDLSGSLREINTLKTLLKKESVDVTTWSKTKASEANFKKYSASSPKVIHLATHGFFYDNSRSKDSTLTKNNYKFLNAEEPLLRSGLLLSGANIFWGYDNTLDELEDGILTAMEVANLDLSNTELVILSACETALGDVDATEGVYGLQRGFKMAGVEKIIMSLWRVPDTETAEFMRLFYENWLQMQHLNNAFIKTQRSFQKAYKNNPENWAAFILYE